eukprot:scaffold126491_cov37-Prasinocladus_malaysianus.AAC.1
MHCDRALALQREGLPALTTAANLTQQAATPAVTQAADSLAHQPPAVRAAAIAAVLGVPTLA